MTTHAATAHRNLKKGGSPEAIRARAERRRYRAGLRARRLAAGECQLCGKPVTGKGLNCDACKAKARERAQKQRNRANKVLLKFRMCPYCKTERSLPGVRACRECHEHDRQYKIRMRAKRIAQGVCSGCGGKVLTGKCCEACKASAVIRNRENRRRKREQV